jgi:hypothetical protein
MPTIDELDPALAAADTDVLPASQGGVLRRLTRAQLVAGLQPNLAVPPGALLGRAAAGTGAPAGRAGPTAATVAIGVAAWAVMAFWAHGLLFGVKPFGG